MSARGPRYATGTLVEALVDHSSIGADGGEYHAPPGTLGQITAVDVAPSTEVNAGDTRYTIAFSTGVEVIVREDTFDTAVAAIKL